jgi:hypothetical protein
LAPAKTDSVSIDFDWSFNFTLIDYFDWYWEITKFFNASISWDSDSVSVNWALSWMKYKSYGSAYTVYIDFSLYFSWGQVSTDWDNFNWNHTHGGNTGFDTWWPPAKTCSNKT